MEKGQSEAARRGVPWPQNSGQQFPRAPTRALQIRSQSTTKVSPTTAPLLVPAVKMMRRRTALRRGKEEKPAVEEVEDEAVAEEREEQGEHAEEAAPEGQQAVLRLLPAGSRERLS